MFCSDLNQQKIEEFFEPDSSKQQSIFKKDQVSLNFTVTSRDSRHPNKHKDHDRKINKNDSEQAFITIARNQIKKFNSSLESDHQKIKNILDILTQSHKNTPIISSKSNSIAFTQIQLLKKQLNHIKQSVRNKCTQCSKSLQMVNIIKHQCQERLQSLENTYQNKIIILNDKILKEQINSVGQKIITDVQIILMKKQNKDMKDKIKNLSIDKQNFQVERSILFSKTKTLEEKLKAQLQKSKGMSATKNSISGGDSLHRPAQSFLFDPSQADYDDWINIFTQHLQCLKSKCKQLRDQFKKSSKQLSNQEKQILNNAPNFILYKKYQKIIQQIGQIKQIKSKNGIQFKKSTLRQYRNSNLCQKQQLLKTHTYQELDQQIKELNKKNICLINQNNNLKQVINQITKSILQYQQNAKQWQIKYEENQQLLLQKSHLLEELQHNMIFLREKIQQQQNKYVEIQKKYIYQCKQIKYLQKNIQDLTSKRQSLQIQNKDLQFKFNKERVERKKLHSQVEDLRGSIRVFCRIRPRLKNQNNMQNIVKIMNDVVILDKGKSFKFDAVFKENSKQQQIFHQTRKLIQTAFDGINICILTYGQTGSGKTYTLHGNKQNPGVTPRMIQQLFKNVQNQKCFYNIIVQMNLVQLYLDSIIDLFGVVTKQGVKIQLKQDIDGNINFNNCPRIRVNNVQQMTEAYNSAIQKRKVSSTDLNSQSSRSHCVFIIRLEIQNKKSKEKKFSKICLIDLAGSQKLTSSNPLHQKQYSSINWSLTCLTKVISAIKKRQKHIPFRQNKLTYLLKDILTSNGKMIIFINISPYQNNRNETVMSLQYGSKIKKMEKQNLINENDIEYKQKNRRSISSFSDI